MIDDDAQQKSYSHNNKFIEKYEMGLAKYSNVISLTKKKIATPQTLQSEISENPK